jgi:LysR family glycine cleavage system transcriptional activator
VDELLAAKLIKSPLEPWRTWFLAHGMDAGEPAEGSSVQRHRPDVRRRRPGLGIALVRLKLGAPWLDNGSLERISTRNVPSPHAHYLCWRTGAMDRWECAAFADWLRKSML